MPRQVFWTVEAHGDDTGYARHWIGWFQFATAIYSLTLIAMALVEAQNTLFAHVGAFFIGHASVLGFLTLAQFTALLFYVVYNRRQAPSGRHGYMTDAFSMKFYVAFIATVVQLVLTGWFFLNWLLRFKGSAADEGDVDFTNVLETVVFFQMWQAIADVSYVAFAAQLLASIAHFAPSRILHHIIATGTGSEPMTPAYAQAASGKASSSSSMGTPLLSAYYTDPNKVK